MDIEAYKTAIRKAKSTRDRTLVALAFVLPFTLERLRTLTVAEAREQLPDDPFGRIAKRLLDERPDHDLVFPSRKGKARPARHLLPADPPRPASRITLWRALRHAAGGGITRVRVIAVAQAMPTSDDRPG